MNALEKVLAKLALLEGKEGNAVASIGGGMHLRQEEFVPGRTQIHAYRLIDEAQPDKKGLGHFILSERPGEPAWMQNSEIDDSLQNKGIGSKAYQWFADHFGGLASDKGETSEQAARVYEKLAPDSFIDSVNQKGRLRRFIPGNPQPKGWGIFGEDD